MRMTLTTHSSHQAMSNLFLKHFIHKQVNYKVVHRARDITLSPGGGGAESANINHIRGAYVSTKAGVWQSGEKV